MTIQDIRKANEMDLFQIKKVQDLTMPEPYELATWKILFDGDKEEIFILEDIEIINKGKTQINTIVGYILIVNKYREKRCHIFSIAVNPGYQSQGFGKQLLDFVINKKDVDQYILEVRDHNIKAIEFYKRQGFHINRKISNFYPNGDSCVVMVYNK